MQKRKLTCFACLRVSLFSVYTEQTVGHSSRSALDAKVKMHFFSVFPTFHYLFWLRLWLFFDGIEGWACEPTSSQNGNLPQCTRDVWQTNRIKSQNKNEGISKEKTRRTATVSWKNAAIIVRASLLYNDCQSLFGILRALVTSAVTPWPNKSGPPKIKSNSLYEL